MRKLIAAFLVSLATRIDAGTVAEFAIMAVKNAVDKSGLILVDRDTKQEREIAQRVVETRHDEVKKWKK